MYTYTLYTLNSFQTKASDNQIIYYSHPEVEAYISDNFKKTPQEWA